MESFGTPGLLARTDVSAHGEPVAPSFERATSWAFPSRDALQAAAGDACPGRFYPRYGHPAGLLCEAKIAALEGAEGSLLFASGMAAISGTMFAFVEPGDRIAISRKCYGGSVAVGEHDLPRFGLAVDWFDPFDLADVERACAAGPRLVHIESPVNPTGRVIDLAAITAVAHAAGAIVSCDATFVPPPLQRTLEHGVDLAIHSATKFLGGHTDILAGCVSGSVALVRRLECFRRRTGAVLAPESAWLLSRSLTTLELRARQHNDNALTVVQWLAGPGTELGVARVHHPGVEGHPDRALAERQMSVLGSVFAVEFAGGAEAATRFFDALGVFHRAISLGGSESVAALPIDGSHRMVPKDQFEQLGFAPHAIRLSVGLEPVAELIGDLEQALKR